MNNVDKMTAAERAGQTVGRWLKSVIRLESALLRRVAAFGIPHWLVLTLKWVVRLTLAMGFLYVAFLPVLVVLMLSLLCNKASNFVEEDWEDIHDDMEREQKAHEPQWRYGHSGWGLYSQDDHVLDVNDENDFPT